MPNVKRITKEIHAEWWTEGEVCVIRRMTYAAKNRLNKKLFTQTVTTDDNDDTEVDVGISDEALEIHNTLILAAGIVSMTDEKANPIDMTPEVIYEIGGLDGEYILEQINELNPTLKGVRAAKKRAVSDADADSSGDSSEEGVPATNGVHGADTDAVAEVHPFAADGDTG